MEEYRAVRAEILASMQQQQQVVSFGVTVLAGLSALTAATVEENAILGLVLGCGGPVVSFVVMLLWIAEIERMTRAGTWVALLESRVRLLFDGAGLPSPMGWENSLRMVRNPIPSGRVLYKYRGLAVVLTLLGSASGVVGFFSTHETRTSAAGICLFVGEMILASSSGFIYLYREKEAVSLASLDLDVRAIPWQ